MSATTVETKHHYRKACDPFTGVQVRIGVMGSASTEVDPIIWESCRRLGHAVAESGCCLLTGACPGIPHVAISLFLEPSEPELCPPPGRISDRGACLYTDMGYGSFL